MFNPSRPKQIANFGAKNKTLIIHFFRFDIILHSRGRGKKNIFVCDISKDKRKQTQTVTKTTASLNIPQSSEHNCPDFTIKATQGDITRDKKKMKQTMISFKKTTSFLKTTPLMEDNPLDITHDTVQKGERFSDQKKNNPIQDNSISIPFYLSNLNRSI